jgi:AcrR family transcriptional regulator
LRRALLDAATMIAERGRDAFGLRHCARRIGVSSAAPTHHVGSA